MHVVTLDCYPFRNMVSPCDCSWYHSQHEQCQSSIATGQAGVGLYGTQYLLESASLLSDSVFCNFAIPSAPPFRKMGFWYYQQPLRRRNEKNIVFLLAELIFCVNAINFMNIEKSSWLQSIIARRMHSWRLS